MPIELTERAAAELGRIIAQQEDPSQLLYLRLGLQGSGATRGYTLDLEESVGDDHAIFESRGYKVTCSRTDLEVLDQTTVDYRRNGAMGGFVFNVPDKQHVTRSEDFASHPEPTLEAAKAALYKVYDPEVGVNIVDLGLLIDLAVEGRQVKIRMTLTTPACPLEGQIRADIDRRVREACPGTEAIAVAIVWEPRWSPERMTPEGKQQLGWSR